MGTIAVDTIERAITVTDWFANEAHRVYALLAESEDDAARRQLADLIRDRFKGSITPRELQRARSYRTADDADAALTDLAKAGYGTFDYDETNPRGGHQVKRFQLQLHKPQEQGK